MVCCSVIAHIYIHGCHSISFSNFLTFHLLFSDFRQFSGPFREVDFNHFHPLTIQKYVQIDLFMLADLIFREKSETINIRKRMFLNIYCLQFMFRNILFLILHEIYRNKISSSKPVN